MSNVTETDSEFTEEKLYEIGEGTHGTIYRSPKGHAIKKIKEHDNGISMMGLREIAAVSALTDSKYVINIRNVEMAEQKLLIHMPFFKYDLSKFIAEHKARLPSSMIKIILFKIIHGIYDAFQLSITHRDVKPQNILINDNLEVQVADWGLSRFMQTHDPQCFTSEVQTLWYRCPELLLGQNKYNIMVDIWSIGAIMYELLCGKVLFPGDSCVGQLMLIFHELGTPSESSWPGVIHLYAISKIKYFRYGWGNINKLVD